jgi:hypothetical protein
MEHADNTNALVPKPLRGETEKSPMPPHVPVSALLVDAPVGRHFAQLHRDSNELVASVSRFVEAGLRRNNGVVIIATPETIDAMMTSIATAGVNGEKFRRSGQLAVFDAAATLERIMRAGMPQWSDFKRVIGAALEAAQLFGTGTRAYGEMVNLLWQDAQPEAAIKLEEFWNEIHRSYPFCLFCAYMLDSHQAGCYHGPLHEIGRTHSDVLSTQGDERFQLALDSACKDVFGIPLSQMLSLSGREEHPGESRLPGGQRTMLWIMRHMPASSADVLERTRRYYADA